MRARRKRERLFERMVREQASALYRWGYNLCHDPVLAEDLVQETFSRAWENIDKLKDDDAARAWLFTILRREFARHCAGRHRRGVLLDEAEWARIPCPATPPHHDLEQAIAQLPEKHRLPLVLQVQGGFSAREIGAILGCSAEAALQRVSRARRQLRDALTRPERTALRQYR